MPSWFLSLLWLLCALAGALPAAADPARGAAPAPSWVLAPDAARRLVEAGALVVDARERSLFRRNDLPGAVALAWTDFAEPRLPDKGKLLRSDAVLQDRLRAAGITASRPVVVVGNPPEGWGEDGRIAWTLRTLGHPQAFIVDGGAAALLQAGALRAAPARPPGDFVVARDGRWDIGRDELRARLGSAGLVVVDVREPREYAGATPYGESRGGHLPGARPLYFKELMDKDGRLLPPPQIAQRLARAGIAPGSEVVSYCTGGIRSAWFTAVLTTLGYKARNYAGSTWEWAAAPAADHPLTRD